MTKKQLLIIIPARLGSSEIKNKNIIKINSKPLIYYTCNFANRIKNKNYEIIGSTDSIKISKIFNKYKVKTPFLRPKNISTKYSLDLSYVNHALNYYYKKKIFFKYGLILRPTSPSRKVNDFYKSYEIFRKNKKATSLKSIVRAPHTPYKMWRINGKKMQPIIRQKKKEMYNMPRQLLPKIYFQDGAFDYFRVNFKRKLDTLSGTFITYFKRDTKSLIDIDNKLDFNFAKFLLEKSNYKFS